MSTRKKTLRKMLSVIMIMVMLFSMAVPAYAETVKINVTGTYYQTNARSMLSLINDFRRSNPYCWNSDNTKEIQYKWDHDLKYDYELEKIAMKRAAEISTKFSHTRPDGSSCYSVASEEGYTVSSYGENIAANPYSAEYAFTQWKEENEYYTGQGHRRAMLGNFTTIGIAVFKVGTRYYCVQEFGYGNGSAVATKANDSETTVSVKVDASKVQITGGSISCNVNSVSMELGSTQALPKAQLELTVKDYAVNTFTSDAAVTFKSSDSTGLAISGTNMTAKKAGTYTLTASASFGGKTYTKNITVTVKSSKTSTVAIQGSLIAGKKNGSNINLTGATVKIVSVSDPEVNVTAKVDGSKFTASVPEGQFKMTVSKSGYVTREYTLNAKAGASFTAELHLLGDVNGDGAVDITDVTKLISHVRGVKKFTDAYDLKVANCDQKGGIDITDVTVAISKVRGIK